MHCALGSARASKHLPEASRRVSFCRAQAAPGASEPKCAYTLRWPPIERGEGAERLSCRPSSQVDRSGLCHVLRDEKECSPGLGWANSTQATSVVELGRFHFRESCLWLSVTAVRCIHLYCASAPYWLFRFTRLP